MSSYLKKSIACLIIFALLFAQPLNIFAQATEEPPAILLQQPQPPMQNVFYNVLWGSATGGMIMMGWSFLDDSNTEEERYSVSSAQIQFLTGATYGGILGLIVGLYLSFTGVKFDESQTKIAVLQPPNRDYFPSAKYKNEFANGQNKTMHLVNFQFDF